MAVIQPVSSSDEGGFEKDSSWAFGCISTGLPAGAALECQTQACERRSRTLKNLSQLPPITGFLSTRDCYTRGLRREMREAQHAQSFSNGQPRDVQPAQAAKTAYRCSDAHKGVRVLCVHGAWPAITLHARSARGLKSRYMIPSSRSSLNIRTVIGSARDRPRRHLRRLHLLWANHARAQMKVTCLMPSQLLLLQLPCRTP